MKAGTFVDLGIKWDPGQTILMQNNVRIETVMKSTWSKHAAGAWGIKQLNQGHHSDDNSLFILLDDNPIYEMPYKSIKL